MSKILKVKEVKTRVKRERKIAPPLPPEERFRALANLIIDRILEEQSNGKLEKLFTPNEP